MRTCTPPLDSRAGLRRAAWVALALVAASIAGSGLANAAQTSGTIWEVSVGGDDAVALTGGCSGTGPEGTLRWAVDQFETVARSTPGDYTISITTTEPIRLNPDCSLHVTSPPGDATSLTIQGLGSTKTLIDAGTQGFGLYNGSQARTGAVTIAGLSVIGDEINLEANAASLTLRDVSLTGTAARPSRSAADAAIRIGAASEVTVEDSTFAVSAGSLAFSAATGLGAGSVSIIDTTFVTTDTSSSKTGVYLRGTADFTLDNVTVDSGNLTGLDTYFRVGLDSEGAGAASVTITNTTMSTMAGFVSGYLAGEFTVEDSTFTTPDVDGYAEPYHGAFELRCEHDASCRMLMNRTSVESVVSSHTPTVFYGGLHASAGTDEPIVIIENSTFTLKRSSSIAEYPVGVWGAGIDTDGSATPDLVMRNNTVIGTGASILASLDPSTQAILDNNVIDSGDCAPLGYRAGTQDPLQVVGGGNVITSNSISGENCLSSATMPDGIYTIVDRASMRLGDLTDNGGGTPTYRPQAGSPLIDAGVAPGGADAAFYAGDQRGLQRVQGAAIDVGAVEVQGNTVQFVEDVTVVGGDDATFTIERSGDDTRALAVTVLTTDGSAKSGVDYEATTTTVRWADGDTSPKTVAVPTIDHVETAPVKFTATIGSLSRENASLGARPSAIGTIVYEGTANEPTSTPTPVPTVDPGTSDPTEPSVPEADAPSGLLASTGAHISTALLVAALALVVGTSLRIASRRLRN
ncbi:hypothetical protein ET495_06740 [Xylanimonas allomyrinae]|uniref:Calx-beta domain-containing protein n=1 Tax=Xylanimonas allomyrinae TaxID=2509459 RepID=A0A4P6EJZ1_9MICO|nr:choice-of-anchor Q domain-containing protein [Xylanimonas allomyrinae]QAY62990.1 hypothetical protein ET495_06740 [Xylanimonas allomyrinae]